MTTQLSHDASGGTERAFTVPTDIPALPLRDTVLFPNSFMPLAVARDSSVKLIDDAIAGAKVIGVFTQKDPTQEEPGEADLHPLIEAQFSRVPAFRPGPEPQRVRDAVALLSRAQKPIIVAGGGVVASQAQAELVELAEKLQIPVATSLTAKGAILDTHPLSVGVVGIYSRACANRAVSEADLVFFVGAHAGGQVTANWRIPAVVTPVVQLDIDAGQLGRNYPNAVSLLGDAKVTLRQMCDAAQSKTHSAKGWTGRVRELVAEWRAAAEPMLASDAVPMRPERICREIAQALPADGVVVSDTGHAGMWTGQMIDITRPGQRYIRCEGSLGWGLPGAMGVKCALPGRPVVCFTGDGGAYYHLQELETAARHGINTANDHAGQVFLDQFGEVCTVV